MIVDVDEFRYSGCFSEHKEQDKGTGLWINQFFFSCIIHSGSEPVIYLCGNFRRSKSRRS